MYKALFQVHDVHKLFNPYKKLFYTEKETEPRNIGILLKVTLLKSNEVQIGIQVFQYPIPFFLLFILSLFLSLLTFVHSLFRLSIYSISTCISFIHSLKH